jgi:hypothetical protein
VLLSGTVAVPQQTVELLDEFGQKGEASSVLVVAIERLLKRVSKKTSKEARTYLTDADRITAKRQNIIHANYAHGKPAQFAPRVPRRPTSRSPHRAAGAG